MPHDPAAYYHPQGFHYMPLPTGMGNGYFPDGPVASLGGVHVPSSAAGSEADLEALVTAGPPPPGGPPPPPPPAPAAFDAVTEHLLALEDKVAGPVGDDVVHESIVEELSEFEKKIVEENDLMEIRGKVSIWVILLTNLSNFIFSMGYEQIIIFSIKENPCRIFTK